MAEPAPAPPQPTVSSTDRLRSLVAVLLRYAVARGKLFQIEAQEAGGLLAGVAVLMVLALGALAGAWCLLMPALVWFAAQKLHQPWEYVAGAVGGAHLFVALVFLGVLKARLAKMRLFEESLNQFERDRVWVATDETQPN